MFMRRRWEAGGFTNVFLAAVILLPYSVGLTGCGNRSDQASSAKSGASSSSVSPPSISAEADFALLDRLVTAESVFPDRAQRGLYRMLPPVTENGQRSYTFQLNAQSGMDETRHFNLVTITWARGGELLQSSGLVAAPSGTGGPGGGFVDAFARTDDHAYDVRVSQGSLLPDSVDLPAFDVTRAAANMVRLYRDQKERK